MAPRPRISRKITVATALGLTEAAAHSPHVPGALISCEGGKERLVVRLTSPGGKPQLFDFTPHLHRRDLAVNFADAFYGWGVAQSATTRLRKKPFLDRFFEYLDEIEARGPSVQPIERLDQLTTHLFNGYVAWLNEPKLRTRGPLRGKRKPWTVKSRSVHFGIVSCIVDWLKNYRPDRLPDDCELPWAPWPGVERKVTPTKILTPQQVAQIEAACIAEIDCTWRRFQLGRQLLSRRSEQPGGHDSELIALLQFIHLEHGDVVKNVAALPNRWSALIATRGGSEALHTFLCATVRSLIPYAILIVSRGFFNTEAVLGANRNVVEDDPLFDERQVVWLDKGRSTKNQRRSFDARRSHAVPNLIEQVLELTEPLLKHVCGTPLERRLFIFKGGRGSKEPVLSFIDINGVLDSHLWTDNLKRFRERHSLPYFTLHMLRKTGSDRVHEATGGNLKAVQKLLGQANPDVTHAHYTSDAMRRRDAQKIAGLQARFVEWIRTQGHADTSAVAKDLPDLSPTEVEAIALGANAVSSGFTCKNPFESPQRGQKRGKQCSAWLGCFTCPTAIIERNAETLARFLHLRAHLVAAQLRINPLRFELLYREKLRILEEDLLPKFQDELVQSAARALIPSLPPLPDLE